MITLTYGFERPQTGDKGSVFFPALEANIQQMNDHTHNGTDSAKLTAAAAVVVTQPIAAGTAGVNWVSQGNGMYRQLVTIPGTIAAVADVRVSFRDATTLDEYHLKVAKASATTYYVYINDNSVSLTAVYTS